MVGTVDFVVPGGRGGDAERVVDRGGHVLGSLGVAGGVASFIIRRTNYCAAANAAAGEEQRLHGSPVVTSGGVVAFCQVRDLRRAAELARHHDQRAVQQAAAWKIVQQSGERPVGGREEQFFAQPPECFAVRVPGFRCCRG